MRLRGRRDRNALTAHCRQMLDQLVLPEEFSVGGFCRAVEAKTGRPIVLHPREPGWGPPGLCGVLASTRSADHVLFTADGSRIGQATTIVHECGHILFAENDDRSTQSNDNARYAKWLDGLVPPGDVTLVRGRTSFSDMEEQTVETFASIVLRSGLSGALNAASTAPGARLTDRFG